MKQLMSDPTKDIKKQQTNKRNQYIHTYIPN